MHKVIPTSKCDSRIVGGQNAQAGQFPYQILLKYTTNQLCGGALIQIDNNQVVLTAAHCVEGFSANQITVIGGKLRLSQNSGNEQSRHVNRIRIHPNYDPNSRNMQYDIAMLGFAQNFQNTSYVSPIRLPAKGQGTTGNVVASGWGRTRENGQSSDTLKWVQMPVISNEECVQNYNSQRVTSRNLCAGLKEGGKDTCQGDSGGPLLARNGNYLAGIVSNGDVSLDNYSL